MAIGCCFLRLKNQLISEYSWMQTVIISVTTTLPWFAGYVNLLCLRSLFCTLDPQFWQGVLQHLTHQPVLIFVVNVVILSIWLTSRISSADDTEAMKEENYRLMSVAQKKSSSAHVQLTDQSPSPPTSPSPLITHSLPSSQSTLIYVDQPAQAGISAGNIVGDSINKHRSRATAVTISQDKPPESMAEGSSSDTPEATVDIGKRSATTSTNLLKSALDEGVKIKLVKRITTLPQPASRVIMRDAAVGREIAVESGLSRKKRMELVMDKDELNQRIEVFFAKFREQMRQESLRYYH